MSLKSFHVLFVCLSIIISIWFGLWAIDVFSYSQSLMALGLGAASLALAGCLCVYLPKFLKKTRNIGYMTLAWVFLHSSELLACAVCFGDDPQGMAKSANAGILFLLGVICTVLTALGGLFVVWARRAKKLGL